jgi:hypothetical protein
VCEEKKKSFFFFDINIRIIRPIHTLKTFESIINAIGKLRKDLLTGGGTDFEAWLNHPSQEIPGFFFFLVLFYYYYRRISRLSA